MTGGGSRTIRTVVPPVLAPRELRQAKGTSRVSVCLPARNEAATIGPICEAVARDLMAEVPLVDELLVLDDASTDATAAAARAAGAEVIAVGDVLPGLGGGTGKGNVLWASVAASTGDVIVWCDSDLRSFHSGYVTRLLAPLLLDGGVELVKAFYTRHEDELGRGGGRTTELMARPLLSRWFPTLATLHQPLAGECAARRRLLEQLPFVQDYGVEVGLLIDALGLVGPDAIVQVDLGERVHRHRPLLDLSEQAAEILRVVLDRAGVAPAGADELRRGDGVRIGVAGLARPPLVTVDAYRRQRTVAGRPFQERSAG